MTEAIPVAAPDTVEYGINHNIFKWPDLELQVEVERITDEGKCELYFFHCNGEKQRTLLHMGSANLLSSTMHRDFAKALSTRMQPEPDWQTVLTTVARMTMVRLRTGAPANIINGPPETSKLHYLVHPLLEVGQPTTIYAPGASGKSYVADIIALLVQFGAPLKLNHFTWRASRGNVLYLDWEGTQKGHERRLWAIKKGLGLDDNDTDAILFYRECSLPLATDLPNVQKLVSDAGIVLTILDSQMAASGYGLDAAQVASHYYNAVKSLGTTTLTIDHVNRQDWKSDTASVGPFGSVVKYNRARSLFQMQKKQYPGEPHIDIAFQHKKHNEGLLLSPMGMRLSFETDPDDRDTLLAVRFESIDPEDVLKSADVESNVQPSTIKAQIEDALTCPMNVKTISGKINKPEATVRAVLHRHKDTFRRDGEMWSLECL